MDQILKGSVREGLTVLQVLPVRFLHSSHHASLRVIMDLLTHLYGMCMSWSTIATHGSTISMSMAPVDGVNIGDLLLIKRLMRGVFKERPSRRFIPAPWDPLRVFGIFQLWPAELPLSG
jgi:hypothetical protein